jgi:hypothetical protein
VSSLTPNKLEASLIRNVGVLRPITQMRLQALMAAAFTAANSYMQAKMSHSNKPHPFRSVPERVVPAHINRTRLD